MIVCISERLKQLRQNKHMTQEEIARRVGVTRSVISAYESGMRQPSYDILVRLAALYGVTTDYLLCVEGKRYVDITALSEAEASVVVEVVNVFIANKQK